LLGVAVVVGVAVRSLFFLIAARLWSFALPLQAAEVLPWARWAIVDRDGAEPYGLLASVIVQLAATGLGFLLLARATPRWRAAIVGVLLVGVGIFAFELPPRPPLRAIDKDLSRALLVVAGSVLAALLIARSTRRTTGAPALLAALLLPISFIPTALPSVLDLACVLAPALRLQHGVPLRAIYMQYDLLPSLLGLAWTKLGAPPATFSFVCAGTYYAMLIGLFILARRMFEHTHLAGPLVLSIVLARMYASMVDASALPQVTPLRLDLWPVLLAAVLAGGLRRWPVGLALALLCFFSRSIGTLYVLAYALALAADFLAVRHATLADARPPLGQDLRASLLEVAPSIALVALSFVLARLVFGDFGSDAVAMYRRLGVGMMRIDRTSFYWWLLPLTGAAGWLAFSRRGSAPSRRAEATIMAVALVAINSMYFFGRSHEHNLINTSAAFLFCLFLLFDMAWPSKDSDPRVLRAMFHLAPYLVVAVCAYSYSQRIITKLEAQRGVLVDQHRVPGPVPPNVDCNEIRRAAGDSRVFFVSQNDFWYYQQCGYTPQGYVQPIFLNVLTKSLVAEINDALDSGAKVFVPRNLGDFCAAAWPEMLPGLSNPERTETPNFFVFRRRVVSSGASAHPNGG
jgi:hypothetical protein